MKWIIEKKQRTTISAIKSIKKINYHDALTLLRGKICEEIAHILKCEEAKASCIELRIVLYIQLYLLFLKFESVNKLVHFYNNDYSSTF
jgi:hypothetical protein